MLGWLLECSTSCEDGQRSDLGILLEMELSGHHLDSHLWFSAAKEVEHLDAPKQCFQEQSISDHCGSTASAPVWSQP